MFYVCSCGTIPEESEEPSSLRFLAGREWLAAKRSRPEMAPQRLEMIESAPGNGMGSEASDPQDLVQRRAGLTSQNDELQNSQTGGDRRIATRGRR